MDEHSREPWRVGKHSFIVDNSGANPLSSADDVRLYGGYLVAESVFLNDARRIVACVNACEGIPTDELESIVRAGKRLAGPRE